ncbi:alkaline phosphatase [Viscerimonas tarda]
MKKIVIFVVLVCLIVSPGWGKVYPKDVKPVKNVILMIPDGTSIGVVSAARWFNFYNKLGKNLNLDPYMCGTVQTFSSNAPIGDSAPTTSCYMTGVPQQTGNVAIYPVADPANDLYPVDPGMAYQPLVTILEAARIDRNKATGMVFTCEFPHATPADCSSHYYSRGTYDYIAPQIAYNNLNVLFGGGNSLLTDDIKQHFANNGTKLIQDDLSAFRNYRDNSKVWALFGDRALPYDLDRDPAKVPSLEEMTSKAIDLLSKDKNGFFLMVEGSQVDWAAHANDPVGCISEFLAFDKAVGAAIEFAKKNGETAVIILPDHGNSGFTIGRRDLPSYDRASIEKLFGGVSKIKRTSQGMEKLLLKEKPEKFAAVFKEYTGIDLTGDDVKALAGSQNYKLVDYMKASDSKNMGNTIVNIFNKHLWFGFTSGGHTGEEVFLAAYHPQGTPPTGMNTNMQINAYLFDVLGLKTTLPELTKKVFAKHTEVFKGLEYTIDKSTKFPVLIVKKGGNTLEIPAFKSVAYLNKTAFDLGSVAVYIDKNDTFYLPAGLGVKMK